MLATSFAEAAGVAGRQKWGLVLSSSTGFTGHLSVVGVRYPDSMEQVGILVSSSPMRNRNEVASPVFWDVPRADMHAVEDIGAVVEWLTDAVISVLMPSLA